MAKIKFYPIEVIYKVIEGKPVIHLFGKTIDGKQICVLYDGFEPYFYIIPVKDQDIFENLKNFKVKKDELEISLSKVEKVRKRYIGKDVDAYKAYTKVPFHIPIMREELKNFPGVESINENDILYVRRFMIDNKIVPLNLYEIEGESIESNLRVPAFKAKNFKEIDEGSIIKPKILSFDIETYTPNYKEIDPNKNPIIMIALYGENFKKVYTWKKYSTKLDYLEFVDSEADLIKKFREDVINYHPDILTGYFSDGFDLPYIKARADKFKIRLDMGLDHSELRIRKGITVSAEITGLTHLDVFKFIRKVMAGTLNTDKYNLDSVASELLGEKKHDVDLDELSKAWDHNKDLDIYCEYNLKDSELCYKLAEKIFPTISELVKITGLTIFDVNRMGFSQLVEWYLLKQAPDYNQIAPNKPNDNELMRRRATRIKGAFVFEPKPGLYKDIIVFDYLSLYPTIIGSHNVGPGSLNCSCCEGKAELAPTDEGKIWFCEKKKGFISEAVINYISTHFKGLID